ncbi:hypothetical protein LEMLEM_LOCUS15135 [Lemmus lemmus]
MSGIALCLGLDAVIAQVFERKGPFQLRKMEGELPIHPLFKLTTLQEAFLD